MIDHYSHSQQVVFANAELQMALSEVAEDKIYSRRVCSSETCICISCSKLFANSDIIQVYFDVTLYEAQAGLGHACWIAESEEALSQEHL